MATTIRKMKRKARGRNTRMSRAKRFGKKKATTKLKPKSMKRQSMSRGGTY